MRKDWVLSIKHQCEQAGVPFFFKQWGGTRKHVSGRALDGQTYSHMPGAMRMPLPAYPDATDTRVMELPLVADAAR